AAWKTASKDGVKFDPRSRVELNIPEPLAEVEGKVAGLLHGPLAGGVRGDPTKIHPAGAMLDEHQHVQSPEKHGVHVQEIDCDDPGGPSAAVPDRCPRHAGSPTP